MSRFILCVVVVLSGVGQVQAEIIIDSSTTIDYRVEDELRIVAGTNPPTVVEVVSPAEILDTMAIYGSSTLSFLGGSTSESIGAFDSSAVSVYGGEIAKQVSALDSSTVNMVGGETWIIGAFGVSTVSVSGGTTGILGAFDSSTVSVSRGEIANNLTATSSNPVSVSGGAINLIGARDSGEVIVTGGEIGDFSLSQSGTIIIHGTNFNYGYGEIADISGQLVGTLKNGDPIDASFLIRDSASIILVVPEPSTLPLLATAVAGLLALSFTRRRRR